MAQGPIYQGPIFSNPNDFVNYSKTIPTTSTLILPSVQVRRYLFLVNAGPSSGPNLWLSWVNAAGVAVAGSIPLGPYGNSSGYPSVWEFGLQGGIVFPFALYGISDSQSSVSVQMTCWTV